jgi:3-hydroxyacyl-CoA dehydrogenase/enoyl-CoA hydratase/3-hydroxybutyryl-CoA epimerase/enoyl-CoA isomerase
MFKGQSIQLVRLHDSLVELRFDRQQQSINKLDTGTIMELQAATQALREDASIRGMLVTSAKASFIVGADIFEFTTLFAKGAEEIERFIAAQSAIFTAFEDLAVPIVTAINGLALGGGFEMALASDYRIMTTSAQVGFPEVSLGIFPGFGGCVRLPRLCGAKTALEWIVSGKPQKAEAALAANAVDGVVSNEQLRDAALAMLQSAVKSGEWRARREVRAGAIAPWDPSTITAIEAAAAKAAAHYPAALAAVAVVSSTAHLARDAALLLEARSFGRTAATATAAALIQLFINDQMMKKKTGVQARIARKVSRAAIVGAGIMGGGIAYTSAVRGIPVQMQDIAQAALDLGKTEARKLIDKQVASGQLTRESGDSIDASITPTLDYSEFESVGAVIEAVVENMNVKKTVLAEIETRIPADAVMASNTSSLSITDMATALQRPENFAGMHFFNPVPAMPLVEVIRGEKTSDITAATIAGYATAMGKTPVVVKDCPGFLVNRVFTPYVVAFLKLVHDGADFEQVDQVMEAFGWPMGPAYLLDVIGLDTGSHVFDIIMRGYPGRMSLDFKNAIHLLADQERFGQKNRVGFYRYEASAKGRPVKLTAPDAHALIAEIQPRGRVTFQPEVIIDRMMLPMIVEAAVCLIERVAETAAEIDTSLILGLGFPRYLGGPLKYADQMGLRVLVSKCERYELLNDAEPISAHLREMARMDLRFHR